MSMPPAGGGGTMMGFVKDRYLWMRNHSPGECWNAIQTSLTEHTLKEATEPESGELRHQLSLLHCTLFCTLTLPHPGEGVSVVRAAKITDML